MRVLVEVSFQPIRDGLEGEIEAFDSQRVP